MYEKILRLNVLNFSKNFKDSEYIYSLFSLYLIKTILFIGMINNEDIQRMIEGIRRKEPFLSDEEREELRKWFIASKNRHRQRRWVPYLWPMAAAIVVIALLSWVWVSFVRHEDFSLDGINPSALTCTTLYLQGSAVEMEANAEVHCLENGKQIEIWQQGSIVRLQRPLKEMMHLAVPPYNKAKLFLDDGSVVTLRGGSLASFGKTHNDRCLFLEGEAYCCISSNPQHPFLTKAGDLTIQVLGTEFLVQAQENASRQCVHLVKGLVEVTPVKGRSVKIQPGHSFVYDAQMRRTSICQTEHESVFAWKEDLLPLNGISLSELLMRIEQLYHIDLSYDITAFQNIHLEGILDINVPIEVLLTRLSYIAPIRIGKRNGEFTITSNDNNP